MAVLRMSLNRRGDVGPGECFLLYTTPPEYGNVAEIYHSDLTVQFLLSKLEKRGSSEHPNIFQFSAYRPFSLHSHSTIQCTVLPPPIPVVATATRR